jgi:hypothetical protein
MTCNSCRGYSGSQGRGRGRNNEEGVLVGGSAPVAEGNGRLRRGGTIASATKTTGHAPADRGKGRSAGKKQFDAEADELENQVYKRRASRHMSNFISPTDKGRQHYVKAMKDPSSTSAAQHLW